MKKLLVILLTLALCGGFAAAQAQTAGGDIPTVLRVGNETRISGCFYTDLWGNNATDMDVRALIHGYNLVVNTTQMVFQADPMVVNAIDESYLDNGDKVYYIALADDLQYCDGSAITADDYIFTLLLKASPEAAELGARKGTLDYIAGYDAYASGASDVLSGVKKLSDTMFTVEVKAERLPYFYEYSYLSIEPSPIAVIAPQCAVLADANGCRIGNADGSTDIDLFTADLLSETLFDAEAGYMGHPGITCGPYMLTDCDVAAGTAKFAVNPRYKGNFEGQKPAIEKIELFPVPEAEAVSRLEDGSINLMTRLVTADAISTALDAKIYTANAYPRDGYCCISFACEDGPAQFAAVRQAVRQCLDQDVFVKATAGDYGIAVNGYYGIGQWMVQAALGITYPGLGEGLTVASKEGETPVSDADVRALWAGVNLDRLTTYACDTEAAKALLIADGWVYNERGEDYDETRDALRHKEVDGALMPLALRWARSSDNPVADVLEEMLVPELRAIGFTVDVTELPFSDMLNDYYRRQDRSYNMYLLGTNFLTAFDPYDTFSADAADQGVMNTTGFTDERLEELALAMRTTPYGRLVDYCRLWVSFQERFSELLPTVPLYSNTYYDVGTQYLQNYWPDRYCGWSGAVLYADFGAPQA